MLRTGRDVVREMVGVAARVRWHLCVLLAPPVYLLFDRLADIARMQLAAQDPAIIQVPLELLLAAATVMKVALPLLLLAVALMSALHDPQRLAQDAIPDPACPHCGAPARSGEWLSDPCCDAARG